jgi:hypothetical protein
MSWIQVAVFYLGAGVGALPGQTEGHVTAASATSSGSSLAELGFQTAPRPHDITPLYALVEFTPGAYPFGVANDGRVFLNGAAGPQRWKSGQIESLQIPEAGDFAVTGMNRSGAVLGYSSRPANEGPSCLSTNKGWYWSPHDATAVEISNAFHYTGFDECAGRDSEVKRFNPILLDPADHIWAQAAYAADPANSSAFVGLHRWDTPGSAPVQISFRDPKPETPAIIELMDVNSSGVMIGQRLPFNAAHSEFFVGNQAVNFGPIAINDGGDVLGYDGDSYSAILRHNGTDALLPLIFPDSLNSRGDVAGSYFGQPVLLPAEVVARIVAGEVIDYGPYLLRESMPPGWEPLQITALNDAGMATGYGLYTDPAHPDAPAEFRGFMLVPARLGVDFDRDGVVDTSRDPANPDLELVRRQMPWYFWLNDDDDSGETGGSDVPGGGLNGLDNVVNGVRDLVDFFPVHLDIAGLLQVFPPDDPAFGYRLAQADGAASFLPTDLTTGTAGDYQRNAEIARALGDKSVVQITTAGTTLAPALLGRIPTEGKGIILVEAGKPTSKPLRLEVWQGATRMAGVELPLSFSGVDNMFRHVNLTGAVGIAPESAARGGAPNWPDELNNNKALIFVHGYNVNQHQAHGWQAEFFKRVWWSGSRTQFWGVTWYGWESQVPVAHFTPNYHANVVNAFGTAPEFKNFIEGLRAHQNFAEVSVAAHSLGNMVVSSAIFDYAAPVDRYFLIDAAVAGEAYDANEAQPDSPAAFMPHSEWNRELGPTPYPARLWPTNWYKLFQAIPGDTRAKLTWRDRFTVRPNTACYDFHSSGEEVLGFDLANTKTPSLGGVLAAELGTFLHATLPGREGQPNGYKGWVYQEQLKGRTVTGKVLGSNYGGWGFNFLHFKKRVGGFGKGPVMLPEPLMPDEAQAMESVFTDQVLREVPFFRPGANRTKVSTWLPNASGGRTFTTERLGALYGPDGSTFASRHRDTLLARMIPSMSPAAGREAVESFTSDPADPRNFDMSSPVIRGEVELWPAERGNRKLWRHSDLREVAFPYVRGLYDKLVALGRLDQRNP